ncbi:putative immunity protein [Mycolicibacterium sp. 624]|uniref:putative immunity protein n=1 Tax=Mycolicibacterium sp. 624 TaxID=3156314 RepID=UPI00339B4945
MIAMTVDDLRPVALWAADCAERVLPLYEDCVAGDHRPRDAIGGARLFGHGQRRDKAMRALAFAALAAAGDVDEPAKSAARAAQMAVAVAYTHLDLTGTAAARQTMHLLAPAVYAAQACELATGDPAAAAIEIDWAVQHSTSIVRAFVAQMPNPSPPRTRLGKLYGAVDSALRLPEGRQ